jgi:hypothetical protein
MIHKTIFKALRVCLLIFLLGTSVYAAEKVELKVESASGAVNDNVQVKITVKNADKVAGGQFELHYDGDLVEAVNVVRGSFVDGKIFLNNLEKKAKVNFAWAGSASGTSGGEICTVTFKLKKPGKTDLKILELLLNDDDIALVETSINEGTITIKDGSTGSSGGGSNSSGGTGSTGNSGNPSGDTNSGGVPEVKDPTTEKLFSDLSNYSWAEQAINVMAGKGIISGRGDGKFDPGATITRAEFAALTVRMLAYESDQSAQMLFTDVKKDQWYYQVVSAAYQNGLMQGKSTDKFDPEGEITRQEMAVAIGNILGKKGSPSGETGLLTSFSDGDQIASWAKNSVAQAVREGIIQGMDKGRFAPQENANRAQAAVMLYRLDNLITN